MFPPCAEPIPGAGQMDLGDKVDGVDKRTGLREVGAMCHVHIVHLVHVVHSPARTLRPAVTQVLSGRAHNAQPIPERFLFGNCAYLHKFRQFQCAYLHEFRQRTVRIFINSDSFNVRICTNSDSFSLTFRRIMLW